MLGPILSLFPLILSIILPLKWVWRWWVFVILAIFLFELAQPRRSMFEGGGIGEVIGLMIIAIYAFLLVVIISTRFKHYCQNQSQSNVNVNKSKDINAVDNMLLIGSGIVFALFIIKHLAFLLGGFSNGFLIHALIGVFALLVLKKQKLANRNIFTFVSSALVVIAAICFGGIFYSYLVINDASKKANNDPYCVSLSKTKRAAKSFEDFAFLTMSKNRGFDHHSLLLIDRNGQMEPYHWSYTKFEFVPGAVQWGQNFGASVYCRPVKNFFQNFKSNDRDDYSEFYLNGHFWKINTSYLPHISGQSYISISAKAPDFKPAAYQKSLSTAMEVGSRQFMEETFPDYSNYEPTGRIGDLNIGPSTGYDQYYRVNEDKQIVTTIACHSKGRAPEFACQHRFCKNGAMYSFNHSVELLSKSTQMEQDLFNLFESFKEPSDRFKKDSEVRDVQKNEAANP